MKILHTSDWHLGHTLYSFDRTEEQESMLQQMVDIVREEKPDVFLLCGDVYHTPQPSSAIQTLFANALVAIHDAHPTMTLVITAGNHDSGSKHDIFRTPWKALKVHTIGSLNKTSPEDHIIELPGKGFIIAVPYANERNIPEGFFQQLLDTAATLNTQNLPVILTAHTSVKGCDFSGHEHVSDLTIGGIDTLDIDQLGIGYDYLALGHIHHEQYVHTGNHNVRYSGTPLAISFDETFEHCVSIINIDRHGQRPLLTRHVITNPRPLVTLPSEGFATWSEAKSLLTAFPTDIPAYIRLNVEVEDYLPPEAAYEALSLTKDKLCRFCHINTHRKLAQQSEARQMTVDEFKAEAPIDIARRYAEDMGKLFDDDMQRLFLEALSLLADDDRHE